MTIDSLYHKAIAKLSEQGRIQTVSSKILGIKTLNGRVLFVYNLLEELNLLPNSLTVSKTECMSSHYRNLGNQHFKNKEDYKALQYYNLSLLHAPVDSDNYIYAIANRSAVLQSLERFNESLCDIQKVFSMKYPQKLEDKLLRRQSLCSKYLSSQIPAKYVFRKFEIDDLLDLKGERDPNYPCASTSIEVAYNESIGRHLLAKTDISPGQVLVKEDPYFCLLLKSDYLFNCGHCLSRAGNLYPCEFCCFVLYCSEECRNNSWEDYHKIECATTASLIDLEFTKIELLAFRTVIKARCQHPDWDSLYQTIAVAESKLNTPLHGHIEVDGAMVYDSKYYAPIHSLSTNYVKRGISDIFQKTVTACAFLKLLRQCTNFLKSSSDNDESLNCAAKLLLHHVMTGPTNMHSITCNIGDDKGNYLNEHNIGCAPYAFLSQINHSCAPNVVRFNKLGTGQVTLIALRPISKGMQLFDNYGYHHALLDRDTRRKSLLFQYKFNCLCEACFNDWPPYLNMKPAGDLPLNIIKTKLKHLSYNNISKLQKGNLDSALKLYKPLCILLNVLEQYAPCTELADCQETFKQCVAILQDVLPYECSQAVEWSVHDKATDSD